MGSFRILRFDARANKAERIVLSRLFVHRFNRTNRRRKRG